MDHAGKFTRVDLTDLFTSEHKIWREPPMQRFVEVSGIARGVQEAQNEKGKFKGYYAKHSGNPEPFKYEFEPREYGFFRAWLQKPESDLFMPMYGFVPLYEEPRHVFLGIGEERKFKYENILSALKASSETGQNMNIWAVLHHYGNPGKKLPELQVTALEFAGYQLETEKFDERHFAFLRIDSDIE